MGISPRFFLGPLKSAQAALSGTSTLAAIHCGFSRQALSQSALKLTRKIPGSAGFLNTGVREFTPSGQDPGAATYAIQIDDSSAFDAPLVRDASVTGSMYATTGLSTATHFWRVRGVNTAGTAGAWSAVRSFTPQEPPPPATLSTMDLNPSTVVGGNGSWGTVVLSVGAPEGGAVVALSVPAGGRIVFDLAARRLGIPPIPGVAIPPRPPYVVPSQSGDVNIVYRQWRF